MKAFLDQDFLLSTETARTLYHANASQQPIIDYHCHLSPQEIAENRRFRNLHEIWLEGDHYKWRALRTNGIPEELITGDADARAKFNAWAATMPYCLRNPLYVWSHLELQRYFGIDTLLDETTADETWERANAVLESGELDAHAILDKMNVEIVCTTDDPADPLVWHEKIQKLGLKTKVYPTFRPDKAFSVNDPVAFNAWCDRLGETCGMDINSVSALVGALHARHQAFHDLGARLSDHGLTQATASPCTDSEADHIFVKARKGITATPEEKEQFATYMMLEFGRMDAERGWTKQLHIGPLRNNRTALFQSIGPDIGCDSIDDMNQAVRLSWYLDQLDREGKLPKTILYNLNPADNHVFGTMIGNFQDGSIPGKIQYGAAWWFLDQEDGMRTQLDVLSNLGLLSRFVGMLTDSRSFLSYPRHEYFRRILCDVLGNDVASGRIPDRMDYLNRMVTDICYANAKSYLNM